MRLDTRTARRKTDERIDVEEFAIDVHVETNVTTNQKVLTRGRTDHFSDFFLVTLNFDL